MFEVGLRCPLHFNNTLLQSFQCLQLKYINFRTMVEQKGSEQNCIQLISISRLIVLNQVIIKSYIFTTINLVKCYSNL